MLQVRLKMSSDYSTSEEARSSACWRSSQAKGALGESAPRWHGMVGLGHSAIGTASSLLLLMSVLAPWC
jgi:hypothetical protein